MMMSERWESADVSACNGCTPCLADPNNLHPQCQQGQPSFLCTASPASYHHPPTQKCVRLSRRRVELIQASTRPATRDEPYEMRLVDATFDGADETTMIQPSPRTCKYVEDYTDGTTLFPWKDMPFLIVRTVDSDLKKLLKARILVSSSPLEADSGRGR